jgi:hypothetical protein
MWKSVAWKKRQQPGQEMITPSAFAGGGRTGEAGHQTLADAPGANSGAELAVQFEPSFDTIDSDFLHCQLELGFALGLGDFLAQEGLGLV